MCLRKHRDAVEMCRSLTAYALYIVLYFIEKDEYNLPLLQPSLLGASSYFISLVEPALQQLYHTSPSGRASRPI